VDARLRLAQRFAIDFSALLDDQGRTHVGDSSTSASYFNYGRPVLAVGAGTVVAAVDRHPDQIPNAKVPVPFEATPGNHVIIRLRRGVFAAYAHLRPGSVQVRRGDRVREGQVLAELGNSGNTGGPHLHFQLMNRPSFLGADGLPFVFRRFQLDGRMPSLRAFIDADLAGTAVPIDRSVATGVRRRGLTDLDVVTFPGG
jgi:murein DD-endopeptidase MepM/ murein hydrolase activator NlpD